MDRLGVPGISISIHASGEAGAIKISWETVGIKGEEEEVEDLFCSPTV